MTFFSALQRYLEGPQNFATPDVTRAQQLALGQAIVAVVATLGFDLDAGTEQMILIVSGVLATTLPASDVLLRRSRAQHAPNITTARERQVALSAAPAAPANLGRLDELEALSRELNEDSAR
jgi:hypothetical protein